MKNLRYLVLAAVLIIVMVMLYGCSAAGAANVASTTEISATARDPEDFLNGGIVGLRVGIRPFVGLEQPKRVYTYSDPSTDPAGWLDLNDADVEVPWWREEDRVRGILGWIGGGLALAVALAWKQIREFFDRWRTSP